MSLAKPFFSAILGKPVSHVWPGHGSAFFLEFGDLANRTRKSGAKANPNGELTLMIEWSWRIERPKSVLGGSWSSQKIWPGMFQKLLGGTVTDIQLFGVLPEVCVFLSNGMRVSSFMISDGQPAWALIARTPKLGSLCVRRGSLFVELPDL